MNDEQKHELACQIVSKHPKVSLQAAHDILNLVLRASGARAADEGERLRKDAERFQKLQNMDPKEAQAFFWHFQSRKQRAKAIDDAALRAGAGGEG